tara:strand:+ start:3833 stop:5212 length:1380 start_codon:yes stop_codon:yes gene_type:complete
MVKKEKDLEFGFMGKVYITPIKHIEHTDLIFWDENPRIFNKIRRKLDQPLAQKEIENFFFDKKVKWTRELMKLIKDATRVNEPLFVQFNDEDKSYIVYEGNTRLAAVRRLLNDGDNKVPADLPCRVIPQDVEQGVINAIVGQAHLKGKENWDTFEANSYLHREFMYRKENGDKDQDIYLSLKGEFGVNMPKVKLANKTFEFIKKHNLTDTHWAIDKYSHWEEFNKIQAKRDVFDFFNDPKNAASAGIEGTSKDAFDKAIIKLVKDQNGPISWQLKEDLKLIGKAAKTGNMEPIKSILNGERLVEAKASVDEDRQDVISAINAFHKKILNVEISAIKKEIKEDRAFAKKVKFLSTRLKAMVDIKGAIKDTVTDKPFMPKDPNKEATYNQTWYLATIISTCSTASKEMRQRNKIQKYFLEGFETKKLTQGEVYRIAISIHSENKVPKDVITSIEDHISKEG